MAAAAAASAAASAVGGACGGVWRQRGVQLPLSAPQLDSQLIPQSAAEAAERVSVALQWKNDPLTLSLSFFLELFALSSWRLHSLVDI